ncbi:MAG: hypothetical protein VCF25_16765 [Candidatus Poribacteria bacterium]
MTIVLYPGADIGRWIENRVYEILSTIFVTNGGQIGTNQFTFTSHFMATFTIGFFFVFKDLLPVCHITIAGHHKLAILLSKWKYLAWLIS